VELLQRPDLSDEQRGRAVARLAREAGRMDSLVNDLLFLAEVRELRDGGDELVEISDVVAASAHDFALDHPERPVSHSITPGLAIIGRTDYVERLLGNALGNVLRHTNATDAVRVTLVRDGGDVVLRVDDAGPGLPAGSYGAVPESFQRFDPSRSRDSGGSGLGMSIMADVAVALHGTMSTARSDLGGLAVIVRLPLQHE
jgi:signal transduction histidine kinase